MESNRTPEYQHETPASHALVSESASDDPKQSATLRPPQLLVGTLAALTIGLAIVGTPSLLQMVAGFALLSCAVRLRQGSEHVAYGAVLLTFLLLLIDGASVISALVWVRVAAWQFLVLVLLLLFKAKVLSSLWSYISGFHARSPSTPEPNRARRTSPLTPEQREAFRNANREAAELAYQAMVGLEPDLTDGSRRPGKCPACSAETELRVVGHQKIALCMSCYFKW